MYGVGYDEARDLQEQYNFGGADPATTTNRSSGVQADPEEVHVTLGPLGAEQENDYSPRNDDVGFPSSPYAFGSGDGSGAVSNPQSSFLQTNAKKDKKSSKKDRSLLERATGKGKDDVTLETRWKNALKEEQRLNALESTIAGQRQAAVYSTEPEPNFPPKFLCIHPLVYHSIDAVPAERQLFIKMAFWDWVAVCILLVANTVVMIVTVSGKRIAHPTTNREANKPATIALSVVYMVLGIPLSFLIWYWRLYRCVSTGSPGQYIAALCGLIISLAQSIFFLVGPFNSGVCGAVFTKVTSGNRAVGYVVVTAIVTALWGLQTFFEVFMVVKCFIYYRKDLAARRRAKRQTEQQAVIG